jgi:hypothetical protein
MKTLLFIGILGLGNIGYCVEEELSVEDITFIDEVEEGIVEDTQLDLVEVDVKDKLESFTEIGE